MEPLKIAVLLPCYNEATTVASTVESFRLVLPEADIYVYDNHSDDNTAETARQAGAIVRFELRRGKGEVIRRMFADIEADIYIMADGDNTYEASAAPQLVRTLTEDHLDMIIGARSLDPSAYPAGHRMGNRAFSGLINLFFGASLQDVFSGYRVMSRRFVKSIPVISYGFEIETEITVHALHQRIPIREVSTTYQSRPEGSNSKLRTMSDGIKILSFILFLLRDVKPLMFFSVLSLLMAFSSLFLGIPVINEFIETGLVERFPTAILASALGILSALCLLTGMILDNVSRGRQEYKSIRYLSIPSLNQKSSES